MKLTATKLQEMTSDPDCIKVVNTLFIAVAYCETVRAIIEPKKQEIVDFYKFKIARDMGEIGIIKKHEHMYLSSDEDFQIYMKEMDKFHKEQGFKKPGYEYCPLLMAESTVRDIKVQVCNFLEPWIGIKYSDISWKLDTYKKYFDLIMTMFASSVAAYQKANSKINEVAF
jgi:hypothetical protein